MSQYVIFCQQTIGQYLLRELSRAQGTGGGRGGQRRGGIQGYTKERQREATYKERRVEKGRGEKTRYNSNESIFLNVAIDAHQYSFSCLED